MARTNKQSAIPASRLTDWQIYLVEESLGARTWTDRATGERFYAVDVEDLPLASDPPSGYLYIPSEELSDYQVEQLNTEPFHQSDARGYQEDYYLVQGELPPVEAPPIKPAPAPPPGTPKKRKVETPKIPVTRTVLEVDSDGRQHKYPVTKIPLKYGTVLDIDEKPPLGYRTGPEVIARIKTERGVQYILAPGVSDTGEGDDIYRQISLARGTYDVRTRNYAKRGPRALEALGEGHEVYKGNKGKFSKFVRAIARAFIKGGGKYRP